jgi:hypothetical protein
MSATVWINEPPCDKCGRSDDDHSPELNITYNLSGMLYEAGFVGWRFLSEMPANAAGRHILGVLNGMADNPQKWRAKNPSNGWGKYDECIQGRMRAWAERCVAASKDATIGASL